MDFDWFAKSATFVLLFYLGTKVQIFHINFLAKNKKIGYSWLAKRVVSWSSLDWDRGRFNQLDLVLGTLFDVMIHAINSVLLIQHLTSIEGLVLALILDALFVVLVLFNPKFAWATPNKVPNWVQKRVRALSEDERQAIQTFDQMEKMF